MQKVFHTTTGWFEAEVGRGVLDEPAVWAGNHQLGAQSLLFRKGKWCNSGVFASGTGGHGLVAHLLHKGSRDIFPQRAFEIQGRKTQCPISIRNCGIQENSLRCNPGVCPGKVKPKTKGVQL